MSKDIRIICGNIQFRRYAYIHKRDGGRFGLLEAVDYKDARKHLGSAYYIRQTWLTPKEVDQVFDKERKWEIVSSIFHDKGGIHISA